MVSDVGSSATGNGTGDLRGSNGRYMEGLMAGGNKEGN